MGGSPRLWLAFAAAAPMLLGLGRLLPADGLGLALRLAGAAALVFLLPGAVVVRALGTFRSLGLALAGALVWSLLALSLALALTFAFEGTLGLTLALVGAETLAALFFALRATAPALGRSDVVVVAALVAAGAALGGAIWWATDTIGGSLGPTVSDALFHLGRVRKLDEGGTLTSIGLVNEIAGADVHPGYAFPLWHVALALVARLAGVDPALVVLYLPAVLTPLALVIGYAVGAALFGRWAGGIATVLGQLALVAFARDGVGWLQFLSQPGGAARLLLVPGLLALVFAYVADNGRALLVTAAGAAFVLAVVHPTYVIFTALPLVGFLCARVLLGERGEAPRIAVALAAVLVPAGLFLAWLVQFAGEPGQQRHAVRFTDQVEAVGSGLRLRPEQMAWGGGVKVAALAAVPLAVLAGGRRWSAYVLGGTLAVAATALVPPLFELLADAVSLSQAVRLAGFLPLAFALAGAAVLAGRARLVGVGGALGAGIGIELAYRHPATGAGWAVWLAALGAAAAVVLGALLRRRLELDGGFPGAWAALAAAAFVVPIAVAGFARLERWDEPDPYGLTPGLSRALRDDVPPLAVVFAPSVTSYRLVGAAPVRVVVAPPGHVAFNTEADYRLRQRAARRFFLEPSVAPAERARILERYSVRWIVVDKTRGEPRLPGGVTLAYADERYALYRVDAGEEPA